MNPTKHCPSCLRSIHAARKQCDCGHAFRCLTTVRTEIATIMRDEQVLIQDCFPPKYVYLGSHKFNNTALMGDGIVVHMAKTPAGEVFQRESLPEIVAIAWNNCLKRTKVK